MVVWEGVYLNLPEATPSWVEILLQILILSLAVSLGIALEFRLSKPAPTVDGSDADGGYAEGSYAEGSHAEGSQAERTRLETDLWQLSQEMDSRAQEQAKELARLNVELQLEMAMHKQAEEIAHTNEERFRNMADNIQEGLTIIENGRLVYLNERACEIFGDCPDADIYNRIYTFAAPEERARLNQAIQNARRSGSFPQVLEFWIQRKDGERRCVSERYSQNTSNGVDRTFIVTSDITNQVQAYQVLENAVNDRTRELSTLLEVSQKIATTLELEPLLHLILEQIQKIIPYRGVAFFTLDQGVLTAVAYEVPGMPLQENQLSLTLARAGPYRKVILEKKIQIVDDIHGDTPLARAFIETSTNPSAFSFEHAHSWIGIPLLIRDRVIGMLSLAHSEPNFYTQRHARLATTIANQVAVAIENARLYEQAQHLAVVEERDRIARELHDSVTQLLYGISLLCTATSRSLRGKSYALVEQNLADIKDHALQALQEMRLLLLELNPPLLQKAGLVAALQASLEVIETRTGLQTELNVDGVQRLARETETELYRIAMEALNNLVRYARAKQVTVEIKLEDDMVQMQIRDNGVGFDLAEARKRGTMGLHTMEERARRIGGSMQITSNPGTGTCIKIEAPVEENSALPVLF
jgi:PAS domain S-box-containing protein